MTTMPAVHPTRPRLPLLLLQSLLVGLATFAFSCLFQAPVAATWNFGDMYAAMAEDPFGSRGPFPHRLLGPLIAHALGMSGGRYWLFHHATVVVFLAVVFFAAATRGCSRRGAVVLTLAISITGAVELYKGHVGYPEPITFSLLVASVLSARRTGWFWLLQFVALTNHENALFLWPWLLLVKANANGGLRRGDWVGAGLVVLAYALFRWAIMVPGDHVYSFSFYLSDQKPMYGLGICTLTVLAIPVGFGAMPALLAWQAWFDGWRRAGAGACCVLVAIFGMSWVAADMMRFTSFLAVPLVFAGVRLLHQPRGIVVLFGLAAASKLIMVGQHDIGVLVFTTMGKHLPDPVSAVVPEVVPELWYVFLGYLLWHLGTVLLGRWSARRWPGRAHDDAPAPD